MDKDPLCDSPKYLSLLKCANRTTNKGGPTGPLSFNNGFRGNASKEHRYYTILFGKMTIVSRVNFNSSNQARPPSRVWVQRSLDGISFTDVELLFIKYNGPKIGVGNLSVSTAIRAMGLRLSEHETEASFSIGIYGCTPSE
ncbi:hypothetical protein Ciccas_014278, partial [Cichlidogyrus casuarinus]